MCNCSKCNLPKPIVNKKYNLCDDCNYMRLHDGKSKAEVLREKASTKIATVKHYQFKSKKPLSSSQKTAKQIVIDKALQALKNSIRIDEQQNGTYYCKGCGHTHKLDCSHILSVKHRKDLELVRENINLLCRTCHINWESNLIHKMAALYCFEKDLLFIKNNDVGRYNKLILMINDFCDITFFQFEVPKNIVEKIHKLSEIYDYIL